MGAVVAMIAVIGLLAYIAKLLGRSILTVALLLLLGAMLTRSPGILGNWTGELAGWVIRLPASISALLS